MEAEECLLWLTKSSRLIGHGTGQGSAEQFEPQRQWSGLLTALGYLNAVVPD